MLRKISSKNLVKLYAEDEIKNIINDRFGDVEMIKEWHGFSQDQYTFSYDNKFIEIMFNRKGEKNEEGEITYNFLNNYYISTYSNYDKEYRECTGLINEELIQL